MQDKTTPQKDSQTVSEKLTPQAVRAQMALPPELQDAYERLVLAGRKIMYSEQMAPQIQELLQEDGTMGDKIGQGVLVLMSIMVEKANGTLPPQLLIPVGMELAVEAGQFLREAGAKVSDGDVADGMATFVQQLLERAGITPDQLPQLLQGQQPGGQPQPGA